MGGRGAGGARTGEEWVVEVGGVLAPGERAANK